MLLHDGTGTHALLARLLSTLACENIRFASLFAAGDVSPRETSPVAKSEEKRMFSQATLPKEIDLQLQCLLYSGLLRSRTGRSHASPLRVACVTPARAAARGRLAVQRTFKWSKNTSKLQNTVIRVRSKTVETVSNQVKWVKSVQYMSPYMKYLP